MTLIFLQFYLQREEGQVESAGVPTALGFFFMFYATYHEKETRWNLQGCHLHVASSPYRAHVCMSMKP
jgi:hypothetical protein